MFTFFAMAPNSVVVLMLDYQAKGRRFKSLPRKNFFKDFCSTCAPTQFGCNILTIYCQWEDEITKERTGHPYSYVEAEKMKLVPLHTHGCLRASEKDCSSCFGFTCFFSCYLLLKA